MPAANQAPLGATRIRSTGLPHSAGGAGVSTSSIPEVAVGRQRDTRKVRAVFDEGRRGFTNQRREDAGVAVRANGIASAQQQASAVDANTPVGLHVRSEIGDHPDLTGRVDAADNVPNHVREAAVRVGGTRHVR